MKLLLKTRDFLDKAASEEISKFTKVQFNKTASGIFEADIKDEKELSELVYNLMYYSKFIEHVYLKVMQFENIDDIEGNIDLSFLKHETTFGVAAQKSFSFDHHESEKLLGKTLLEFDKRLKVDLEHPQMPVHLISQDEESYLLVDLIGFRLSKRGYKINKNYHSVNSLVPNYLFYLMEMKGKSVVDPMADRGEIIIEAENYLSGEALNVRHRETIPLLNFFSHKSEIPEKSNKKTKAFAIVQDSKTFKMLKENLSYTPAKIKVSQFDLDYLDAKFKNSEFEYLVSYFPSHKDEEEFEKFQRAFFYQAAFICKKKIGIISIQKLSKKILKENDLKIELEEELSISENRYTLTVIST